MPQSLSSAVLHVVFSTKDRVPNLSPEVQPLLHAYMSEVARGQKCYCYRVGGVADHVHIAVGLARTISVADLVQEVKAASSKWVKDRAPGLREFAWQAGYGAFSIQHQDLGSLLSYIDGQHEHHKKQSFKEEYLELLAEHGIEYDEKYLWD